MLLGRLGFAPSFFAEERPSYGAQPLEERLGLRLARWHP